MCLKTIWISKGGELRYDITNVSMKDISKIIKEFEKLPNKVYVQKRPKPKPTESNF